MVGKLVWGPQREPGTHHEHHAPSTPHQRTHLPVDLTLREICVLTPLAILCLIIGLYPIKLTLPMEAPIDQILAQYPSSVRAREHAAAALQPAPPTLTSAAYHGELIDG
jgi:NADH:ubiquinone oxidoreductase subunit 4 (subunit M)